MEDSASQGGRVLARDAILVLVSRVVPLSVGFLVLPFVIRGLGNPRYAVLSLAAVITGYFALFDFGLGRAATRFVAKALARGEIQVLPSLALTAAVLQLGFGLIGAVVLASVTPWLVETLNIPPGLHAESRTVFYLLSTSIPILLVTSTFSGLLQALRRFDRMVLISTPFSVVEFLVPLVGVGLDVGLSVIVAGLVATRLLALAALVRSSLRLLPRLPKGSIRLHRAGELLAFGGWITISSIVGPMLVYLERFVLASTITVAAVAFYAPAYTVVTMVAVIPTSMVTALFPLFSSFEGQSKGELTLLSSRSMSHLVLFLGPLIFVLIVFSRPFLELWLGEEFAQEGTYALRILAVGAAFSAIARIPYAAIQGQGRPDLTAKFHLIELAPHIVATWVLVRVLGVEGAALAWSLRVGLDTALLLRAAARIGGTTPRLYVGARTLPAVAAVVLSGLAAAVVVDGISASPYVLLAAPAGFGTVFVGLWFFLMDAASRFRLLEMVRNVRR